MDKYFDKAGNIDDYFKPAGNLEGNSSLKFSETKTADVNDTNNGFYNPGDLGGEVFKTAGDLEDNNSFKFSESKTVTDDEIKSYIASIQSVVRTYGSVSGGGVMFVSFDRLKDMVNSGYNIIRANYFENTKMIEVEFDVPVNHKSR